MKTIAVYGCSHSSDDFGAVGNTKGKPWCKHLAEKFDFKLIQRASPGANVGMYIDKLLYDLEEHEIDGVICQISGATRLTLGFRHWDNKEWQWEEDKEHNGGVKHIGMYTWHNIQSDKKFGTPFMDHFKPNYPTQNIHKFIFREIALSNWMKNYSNQNLMNFITICNKFNKKLLAFSWNEPLKSSYLLPQYRWILDDVTYIEQNCMNEGGFFEENNISPVPGDGHYDSEAHLRLCNEYLSGTFEKWYNSL